MTAVPIQTWLARLKLEEYLPVFVQHGLQTSEDCKRISHDFLDKMGISKLGHRKRLLKEAAVLRGEIAASAKPVVASPSDSPPKRPVKAPMPSDLPPPRPQASIRKPRGGKAAGAATNPKPASTPHTQQAPAAPAAPGPVVPIPASRPAAATPANPAPTNQSYIASVEDTTPKPIARGSTSSDTSSVTSNAPPRPARRSELAPVPVPAVSAAGDGAPPPRPAKRVSGEQPPPRPQRTPEDAQTAQSDDYVIQERKLPHAQPAEVPPRAARAPPSTNPFPAAELPKADGPPLPARNAPKPFELSPQGSNTSGGHARNPSNVSVQSVEPDDDDEEGIYVALPPPRTMSISSPKKPVAAPSLADLMNVKAEQQAAHGLPVISYLSQDVQDRTKRGYLYKRGGRLGTRGWDKRYFAFENGVLNYYIKEKDKKPTGSISLHDMQEIKPSVGVKADSKHANRFELETFERTYYFSAESAQEMTEWMMLLGTNIQMFKPKSDVQLGGEMFEPDKQGYIKKQSHNFREGWNKRYLAIKAGTLCYYNSYQDYKQGNPQQTIDTLLVTVRIGKGGKKAKNHQFQLVTQQRNYEFQADTKEDMMEWIAAIQNSILWSLNQMQSEQTSARSLKEIIPPDKVLGMLRENRDNLTCADCDSRNPEWASINLGILFCINCSGIHRSLGVHLSKVRSTTLDEWTPSLIGVVKEIGTVRSNCFWEAKIPPTKPTDSSDLSEREAFIRAKYERKEFCEFDLPESPSKEEQLVASVKTKNLMQTVKIIQAGVNKEAVDPATNCSIMQAAKNADQVLQVELLANNGFSFLPEEIEEHETEVAVPDPLEDEPPPTFLKGFLHKRGANNTEWRKRWCIYDLGVLRYFKSDVEKIPSGEIAIEIIKSAEVAEEESLKDPNYPFCFEVVTRNDGRRFMFCADTDDLRQQWIHIIKENIKALPCDAIEGFDFTRCQKVGPLEKKGEHLTAGFKKRYFALRGKFLYYFRDPEGMEKMGEIDLRQVTEYKEGIPPAKSSMSKLTRTPTQRKRESATEGSFYLVCPQRTYWLRASTLLEMQEWLEALQNTRVFGVDISSLGSGVPSVVEKCLLFIEDEGVSTEGIYRLSGNAATVRRLKGEFDQDEGSAFFNPEEVTVHDIASLLKSYFRELPDPLMTLTYHDSFIQAAQIEDHNEKLYSIKELIETMPSPNQATLKRMCKHLSLVAEHQEVNKMGCQQLALVFGPTFMTTDKEQGMLVGNMNGEFKCVEACIEYQEWLFEQKGKTEKDLKMEDGMRRLEMAKLMHAQRRSQGSISVASSGSISIATPFIHTIKYGNSFSHSLTIPISADMIAYDAIKLCLAKAHLPAGSLWTLVEVVGDTGLQRLLEDQELVNHATSNWSGKSELRLDTVPAKQMLCSAHKTALNGWFYLKIGTKSWKKFYCECDPTRSDVEEIQMFYFKDDHSSLESGNVPLGDALVYRATDPKKPPEKYVFIVHTKPGTRENVEVQFATADQVMYEQWMACLIVAKQPSYYVAYEDWWANRDDDTGPPPGSKWGNIPSNM